MKIKLLFIKILIATLVIYVLSGCVSNIAKTGQKQIDEFGLIGMDRFKKLKTIGTVNPRRSEDINNSRWGLEWNAQEKKSSLAELNDLLEKMADSGVKWARVATSHGNFAFDVSPENGYYKWKELDKIIEGLAEYKINVFITINKRNIDLKGSNISGEIDEYTNAVAALVKRYSKIVKYWEIMNEPIVTPDYIKTVREASKVIKQIDPDAKVIAGSLARTQFNKIEYLVNNVGSYIDVITFHSYNEFPEANKYNWIVPITGVEHGGYISASLVFEELSEQLGKASHRIELWDGEGGYPSSENTSSWKGRGPWGENIQAKWLLRRFIVNFSLDIPVMIYYYLQEGGHGPSQIVNAKGLFDSDTGQPKQGYHTLQHLTSIFDERLNSPKKAQCEFKFIDEGGFSGIADENAKEYLRENPPYENNKSPYPIEVVAFSGNEGDALTYWVPWRIQEFVKPAKVNIFVKDLDIKDPVLVDLISGKIYQTKVKFSNNGMVLEGVPLFDYPMAVVSRHFIK